MGGTSSKGMNGSAPGCCGFDNKGSREVVADLQLYMSILNKFVSHELVGLRGYCSG